jgi:hypothetical protein
MMRKAVIALLVLITAGQTMADAVPRLPNEFEYWRHWAECGEPYLYCDHTTRTCMSGRIVYEHFVGWVIDANNRRTVVAHVRCRGNACFDYDTGTLVIDGRPAPYRIERDRPSSDVEEMRAQRARGCSMESI